MLLITENTNTGKGLNEEEELDEVPFPDGYTVKVLPTGRTITYIFKNSKGNKAAKYVNEEPLTLTELSTVGREIKKHLNPENSYTKEKVRRDFDQVKQILQNTLDKIILQAQAVEEEEQAQREEELQEKLEEARKILETKQYPLLYVASLVSWLTAGERTNIMLTFVAYCSQVILNNPISVIGLGDGSSGKTHIEEVAMSLIPSQYIIHEKSITEAAMFNRAKENPRFYDGKIVNYGDLGGRNSQDFVMEAKNLLKELQSDGFLNKPLSIPTKDEGWITTDITLYGRPALTYTTVPGFKFDDQEMSRSIFITPRMDNKAVFNARKKALGMKIGRSYKKLKYYEKEAEVVKYIVQLIKEEIKDVKIVNPYNHSVIEFLGESEYFKRDFDKYNGLLETITAFNIFNRQLFETDDEKVLFTSLQDVQLFISLLEKYHRSISVNISPKAAEILDDYAANKDEWIFSQKISEEGITVNKYMEITGTGLTKRSVRRYFGELNSAGFFKVVGKEGRAFLYDLTDKTTSDFGNLLELDSSQCNLIEWELGSAALDFVRMDVVFDGLDIGLQDEEVSVPGWEDYDN